MLGEEKEMIYSLRTKYNSTKVKIDGYTLDSKAEAKRYSELCLLRKVRAIDQFEIHPKFPIVINGVNVCTVVLDFQYWDESLRTTVYEDVKGVDTPMSRLKRKLVKAVYGIDVTIIRNGKRK